MDPEQARDLVTLAERVDQNVLGADAPTWTERLDAHAAELRPAADALIDSGDTDTALRLAAALSRYAQASGRVGEIRELIDHVLTSVAERARVGPMFARALLALGELAFRQGDQRVAAEATEAALRHAGDDARTAARAEMNLARIAFRDGDAPRIFEHAGRMLQLAGDDARLRAGAIHMLAWAEHTAGNVPRAIELFEENVEIYRSAGHTLGVASELANLADLARAAGQTERALGYLRRSIDHAMALRSRYLLPSLLGSASALAAARGRHAEALELAAAAETQYAEAGLRPDPGDEPKAPPEAIAALGEEAAESAAARGRAYSLEQAVAQARTALS